MARGVSPSPQVLSRGKTAASASTTSSPRRAHQAAAEEPAGPAPTIRTSVCDGAVGLTRRLSQGARTTPFPVPRSVRFTSATRVRTDLGDFEVEQAGSPADSREVVSALRRGGARPALRDVT